MASYDAIVLGLGGVGSATLMHVAKRGLRVLGLDRFGIAHDRGSSHGQTRIIRQAYFEHPNYVPLALRSYELWRALEDESDLPLLQQVGLVQIGPPAGEVISGVLRSAAEHDLPVEQLSADEAMRHWPALEVPEDAAAVFESRAGYLRVEACVRAHAAAARSAGAELRTEEAVVGWKVERSGEVTVQTDAGEYRAARLIIAAGAWAPELLADLSIPFEVLRKSVFWYATDLPEFGASELPCFLFELTELDADSRPANQCEFYGFPAIDQLGVKVAEHSGGLVVRDPLRVSRELMPADRARVEAFTTGCLPDLGYRLHAHRVCLYTMSPDRHFIVDRHPQHANVVFAAGLSGHGFKFTPVLGEALADLAIDGTTKLPIEFLGLSRFGRSSS
ncbi:MAG: N-methyl-L-tryptophan oxidase [Pirellulales bacterium]|nr:N-methyl-L-tryptophan oxidase [Pirellulales bacterium]